MKDCLLPLMPDPGKTIVFKKMAKYFKTLTNKCSIPIMVKVS